jgi:predicted nucleic acid-binding protein
LGIPYVGTLGLVIEAKVRGAVTAAAPIIAEIVKAGFRLDSSVIRPALEAVGETWPVG